MDDEKENRIYRHGTTWCSAITCYKNKLTEPETSFFRFLKNEER